MKFRKKQVVIEAIQFTNNVEEIESFIGHELLCNMNGTGVCQELLIPTLEGEMTARINDWIIKGVNGEFYPCKPDIFEKTYHPEDESPQPSKPASCDAMGHYGANPTSSICPKCNQPFNYSQVGKEAIEFAEWIGKEGFIWSRAELIWCKWEKTNTSKTIIKKSTFELYKLFNPKWAEQSKQEAPGDENR